MRSITVIAFIASFAVASAAAETVALEKRVEALVKQVATLKEENRQLKESAVDFLSVQLAAKERERARLVYRTQVLPLVKEMLKDYGAPGPELPKEAEIETMIDAYRPFTGVPAFACQCCKTTMKTVPNPVAAANGLRCRAGYDPGGGATAF